ncbi:MAG: GlsB/YeaQ/YmgE family stress response membrane protein [Anaerolineales bacterium]
MGILFWIVFGGLSGWIASIITKRNDQMGCLTNIVIGILGALLGGWVGSLLGFGGITGFNFVSMLMAVLGAVVLLVVLGWFQRR